MAARPKGAAGARSASQGSALDALARAQLSGALRLVSAEAMADVERFGDPNLIAAGKVSVISLEAVQHSFGDRWQARKEEVFAFAEEVLARGLGTRGVHLRISDTDFFLIHPKLGRLQGQAACLGYLRQILSHFVGGAATNAVDDVLLVTRIGKGKVETEAVDAAKVEAIAQRGDPDIEPHGRTRLAAYHDENGELASRLVDRWTPFVAADGRTLRISATLEPVYELKGFTRIGFRMIRRVIAVETEEELTPQQVGALSTADLLRADLATITRGIDRLNAEGGGERQLSLIVPVSFSSLSTPRGRAELIEPVREASGLVRLGVICEILDVEGIPQSALVDVTSLVRPLSLLVVARLSNPTAGAMARVAGAGFQALSFECPRGQLGDAEFLGWASRVVRPARKVAKSVVVYRAGTMQRAGALASLGATHVSLDAT
jgi:hypothetical protein